MPHRTILQYIIAAVSLVLLLRGIVLLFRRDTALISSIVAFFFGGLLGVVVRFPNFLPLLASVVGVGKGGDAIVYASIVLLSLGWIMTTNAHMKQVYELTRFISATAIQQAVGDDIFRPVSHQYSHFAFLIKAYNEETVLGDIIDTVINAGYTILLLVNDGSRDATLEIMKEKRAQYPQVRFVILSHTINRGAGSGNNTGFRFVRQYGEQMGIKRVVMFDGDGQMDIADMQTFHEAIDRDSGAVDVYFGSRFVGIDPHNMPWTRKLVVRLGRILTWILYGIHVTDHHCGYRVLSLHAIQKISLQSDRRHYANELCEQVKIHQLSFREIPVHISYSAYSLGKSHGQRSLNSILLGLQMIYRKLFYR